MALENTEVLGNLRQQLHEVTQQVNQLADTRLKLLGAIDVLEQIEDSKTVENETSDEDSDEVVETSPLEEVLEG